MDGQRTRTASDNRDDGKEEDSGRMPALVVAVAVGLRFLLGAHMPLDAYSAVRSPFDDLLMVEYAQLGSHFHPATDWDQAFALVKTMSFPVFLNVIGLLGVPYRVALTGLYCLGAFACVAGLRRMLAACRAGVAVPGWGWCVAFVFLLYCPAAFDYDTGSKIYREPVLVPTVMVLAGLMLIYAAACWRPRGRTTARRRASTVLWGLLLGLVWSFYWYVKESGVWLAPLLLVTLASCAVLAFRGGPARSRVAAAVMAVTVVVAPLGVFGLASAAYAGVNRHYFGVPYSSIRTEGEVAGFFSRLYTVASDERTDSEWVPWSVVEQARDASPTLRAHPEIVEWMAKGQFGGAPWAQDPPDTDMGVWTLIWDLVQAGDFDSQTSVQDLFRRINTELDAARLPQSGGGLRPSASVAPKTLPQIWALRPSWWMSVKTSAFWRSYEVRDPDAYACDAEHESDCRLIETTLGESIPRAGENGVAWRGTGLSVRGARAVIRVYQFASFVYLPAAVLGVLLAGVAAIRGGRRTASRKAFRFAVLAIAGVVGSVMALLLATSWVTYPEPVEAMIHHSKYYTAAAAPLIQVAAVIGVILLVHTVGTWRSSHDGTTRKSARD